MKKGNMDESQAVSLLADLKGDCLGFYRLKSGLLCSRQPKASCDTSIEYGVGDLVDERSCVGSCVFFYREVPAILATENQILPPQ
jgi:hypothetical protein